MAAKRQHFVPRVYLKSWEGKVRTIAEPERTFDGVYLFEKPCLAIGNGRKLESVMVKNNTYTIDYDHAYICQSCPEVLADLVHQIRKILQKEQLDAYYKGVQLSTDSAIGDAIYKTEDWEFRNSSDGTRASQKRTIHKLKTIRSSRYFPLVVRYTTKCF